MRIIDDSLLNLNKDASIILITPMQRGDFVYINNTKHNAHGSYQDNHGQSLAAFAAAVTEIAAHEKLALVDLYNKSGMTVQNMVKFKSLKDAATGQYKNYTYPDYIGIPFNAETNEYPYSPGAIDMTYDGLHHLIRHMKLLRVCSRRR